MGVPPGADAAFRVAGFDIGAGPRGVDAVTEASFAGGTRWIG